MQKKQYAENDKKTARQTIRFVCGSFIYLFVYLFKCRQVIPQ